MKITKLKSYLFSLMAITMLTVFLSSCEKDDTVKETPTISKEDRALQLKSDPDFVKLNELNNQLLQEVFKAMESNDIDAENLKNIYLSNDIDGIAKFMEATNIEAIMTKIQPIAKRLSSDYKDIVDVNQNFDEAMVAGGFARLEQIQDHVDRGCGWRYYVCAGGAWSALAACTAGTSGWGVAFCYVAYSSALALCVDAYC